MRYMKFARPLLHKSKIKSCVDNPLLTFHIFFFNYYFEIELGHMLIGDLDSAGYYSSL